MAKISKLFVSKLLTVKQSGLSVARAIKFYPIIKPLQINENIDSPAQLVHYVENVVSNPMAEGYWDLSAERTKTGRGA
jgi:hypothetical protein